MGIPDYQKCTPRERLRIIGSLDCGRRILAATLSGKSSRCQAVGLLLCPVPEELGRTLISGRDGGSRGVVFHVAVLRKIVAGLNNDQERSEKSG